MKQKDTKTKTEWQRKTYPLKLKLSQEQKDKIDSFLYEYKKVTNFVIQKAITQILPFYKKIEKPTKSYCKLCNKQRTLQYQWKTPQGKKELNCGCLVGHYSFRKLFLPSKNYNLEKWGSIAKWDMRFAGKLFKQFPKIKQGGDNLSGTEYNRNLYDSCLQKAVETIKSQNELNKKIQRDQNFLQTNSEAMNLLIRKIEKSESPKIQKAIDFYKKFENKKLKKFLAKNKEKLRRFKNQKAEEVVFKGNMARIYNTKYKWVGEENDLRLQLNIFDKPMELNFFGKDYQKKKAVKFASQEKQPEIELLKRADNYFVQYIFRKETIIAIPDNTFTAVGIDLGILNHFTTACIKQGEETPFGIQFFNGRALRRKRRQYYKIRRIWAKKMKQGDKGGKGRSKKWFKKKCFSQNEKQFVKTELHKATTNLVHFILQNVEKPVIVLEDLKNIRNETKKTVRSHRAFFKKRLKGKKKKWFLNKRYLVKELNNWNFLDMFSMIKYKAEWLGIPVVIVSAKNTSIECNKCGYVDEKNYENLHELKFKCKNCGYACNVDFNAAVNLSKAFFESIRVEG